MLKLLKRMLVQNPAVASHAPSRMRLDLGHLHDDVTIYAIGDVHGRLDLLQSVEQSIFRDIEASSLPSVIIMLGDYVDRGPYSAGVLDHLCRPPSNGVERILICGNHDAVFREFVDAPELNDKWLEFGGRQTLLSYGIDIDFLSSREGPGLGDLRGMTRAAIPEAHLDLIDTMPVCARIGDYLFVHAGIRPGIPLEMQTDEDMMWIREPFLSEGPQLPLTVIHGHTVTSEPRAGPGRIGIDTGAFATDRLTVLRLRGKKVSLLA